MGKDNNFENLVSHIQATQDALQNNARLVINRHVTAKAWLTGYYIVEYEQRGDDRAKYGEKLLQKLSDRFKGNNSMSYRSLKLYRQFYLTYQTFFEPVRKYVISNFPIGQSVIAQLEIYDKQSIKIGQSVPAQLDIHPECHPSSQLMFDKLSFTHLSALLPLKDPLQRAFYETMAISKQRPNN